MPVEPNHGVAVFEGDALVEVLDPTGTEPQNVILDSDDFQLRVTLTFRGGMAPLTLDNAGKEWLLQAYVESVGPGGEQQIGTNTTVPWNSFTTNPGPPAYCVYTIPMNIPATDLDPGLYKLAVVITSRVIADGSSARVYGFTEGNVFQIAAG